MNSGLPSVGLTDYRQMLLVCLNEAITTTCTQNLGAHHRPPMTFLIGTNNSEVMLKYMANSRYMCRTTIIFCYQREVMNNFLITFVNRFVDCCAENHNVKATEGTLEMIEGSDFSAPKLHNEVFVGNLLHLG